MSKTRKSFLMLIGALVFAFILAIAACGKNTTEFTFETNGGDPVAAMELENGIELSLPVQVGNGYSFEGWYSVSCFKHGPVEKVTAEGSATFYARWEQMYRVTLVLNGGTISETELWLKSGANVYDFMQSRTPVKTGCEFSEWLVGDQPLSKGTVMTTDGITLTARYKVGYTIETYLQKSDLSGYERGDDITGFDYSGLTFTPTPEVTGFSIVDHESAVQTLTLTDDPKSNVFKFYFNRNEYTVFFLSNYPAEAGLAEVDEVRHCLYGTEEEFPVSSFTLDGYLLVGWSKSATGGVDYAVDAIGDLLYNGEKTEENATFTVESDVTFYAVWSKGYTDLFGAEDHVFLLSENAKEVYIQRGGIFFRGEYTASNREFYIEKEDKEILVGKLSSDGETYYYYSESRASYTATLYKFGVGLDETAHIFFDGYNGITLAEEGSSIPSISRSVGEYTIDENGYYIVTFTSGPRAGETMTIMRVEVKVNGSSRAAFMIRNEEEFGWGEIMRGIINKGAPATLVSPYYTLTLDGFYIATLSTDTTTVNYYYTRDGEKLSFLNGNGDSAGDARLMYINNVWAYMIYDASVEATYTAPGGDTLVLDGVYKATYTTVGGVTVNGNYSLTSSAFGSLVTVYGEDGKEYTFLAQTVKETVYDEEGKETTVTHYAFEEKLASYAEYYYYGSAGKIENKPFVVLDDTQVGHASVYGWDAQAKKHVKVAEGRYTLDEATGLYTFTVVTPFEYSKELQTGGYDFSAIQSFVFATDSLVSNGAVYDVSYWYSTNTDEGETRYDAKYTSKDTDGATSTLILVNGFAIYEANGTVTTSIYKAVEDGIIVISAKDGSIYFELNDEDKSFIILTGFIGSAIERGADGEEDKNTTLSFDGKGGAVYSVTEGENKTVYEGTYVDSGKATDYGAPIFVFRSNSGEIEFDFIMLSTESKNYFARYNPQYNGLYWIGSKSLELDGFGFKAIYIDEDGERFEGVYCIPEENVVLLTHENGAFYFDFNGKDFTVRGGEYGTYLLIDNMGFGGTYLELDGYGKLNVFKYEDSVRKDLYNNVAYTYSNGAYVFSYTDENDDEHTFTGQLGYIAMGSKLYRAFIIAHEEIVRTFVDDEDYSVLIFDSFGNVTKYDVTGKRENGSYVLITENLLYYVNSNSTDACIYEYDVENSRLTRIEFSPRGYYTKDLDSMVFSDYGFMIFNGETRCYYYIEDDGNVVIFRQDATASDANRYGFVASDFGTFTKTKEWDGKQYFENEGYDINFHRNENTKNNYPVPVGSEKDEEGNTVEIRRPLENLLFSPSGSAAFSVSGQVIIDGKPYPCTVKREVLEDGSYSTYVVLNANFGYYRIDIEVNYTGSSNTYEVTGMKYVISVSSASYWTNFYLYYFLFGMTIGNNVGIIEVITEYDEAGVASASYVNGVFGEGSGFFDGNGKLIASIENAEYTQTPIPGSSALGGLYEVHFEGADGYPYALYFTIGRHPLLTTVYAYNVYALTRTEELETADGYKVVVERVIASDYSVGSVYSAQLFYNGEAIKSDTAYVSNNMLYVIVRNNGEDGKILTSTYYIITFERATSDAGEGTKIPMPPYNKASVEKKEAYAVYTNEGDIVEIFEESNEVVALCIDGTVYLVAESKYDEATSVYTVSLASGKTFTVEVKDGVATITELVTEEEKN